MASGERFGSVGGQGGSLSSVRPIAEWRVRGCARAGMWSSKYQVAARQLPTTKGTGHFRQVSSLTHPFPPPALLRYRHRFPFMPARN